MTEVVQRNWDCTGCGAKFNNFGSLGNHGRFSKVCTPAMRFWGKVDKSAGPGGVLALHRVYQMGRLRAGCSTNAGS